MPTTTATAPTIDLAELDLPGAIAPLVTGLSPAEQAALAVVYLAQVGHGMDLSRPANRRIALRWWSEYLPARVAIAARTCGSLTEAASSLAQRLQGQLGERGPLGERHRRLFSRLCALDPDDQTAVLDALERQAVALVTLVRAILDERKQERKTLHGEAKDRGSNDPGTGGAALASQWPWLFGDDAATGGESVPEA